MYARYIDDVWGVWTHGAEALTDYLNFLNSRHSSIQFTIERSDMTGSIPYLDTLIRVEEDGSFSTELYIKPMAAPIILPFDSAHAKTTKIAVLKSQITRAIRIGSDGPAKERGIDKMKRLFTLNGYPDKIIKEHIRIEKKKHEARRETTREQQEQRRRQRKENRKRKTHIRLPFISDRVAAQVRRVTRNSGLPVEIAWTNGNTLKKQLTRSRLNPLPCPSGNRRCYSCHAGLKNKCSTKNVVYELKCDQCGDTYIGETSRPVRLRYNEHRRNGVNREGDTPFGDHVNLKHPEQDDTAVNARILRVCRDEADRRIAESIYIRDSRPGMNDNTTSWQLLPR